MSIASLTRDALSGLSASTYFSAYRSLKLTRDAEGVLVVEFHTNGGPLIFNAHDHTDLSMRSTKYRKIAPTRS